jgi:hypothetical protein
MDGLAVALAVGLVVGSRWGSSRSDDRCGGVGGAGRSCAALSVRPVRCRLESLPSSHGWDGRGDRISGVEARGRADRTPLHPSFFRP